jgi:hypothetical protein
LVFRKGIKWNIKCMYKIETFDNMEVYKNCTPSGVSAEEGVKCTGKAATILAKHKLLRKIQEKKINVNVDTYYTYLVEYS